MFCPSCGQENPNDFRYCLACGKSPKATVSPSTKPSSVREEPEAESHTIRNVLIGVVVLVVVLIVISNARTSGVPGISTQEPLTPQTFSVKAGEIYFVEFTLRSTGRVVGRFEAAGGGGNDIEAVIASSGEFENWKNGHQAQVRYQSGKTTIGNIDVLLGPGRYYLAFNNKFSLLTGKTITANILLNH